MSLHNLPVSTFPNPDHILEHSEDDTKSLFVIIKVSFSFYSLYEMLLVYPAAGLQRSHSTLCLSAWLQIISDLMFFRGTQKKEFDSRWKSFTLVKKSMENRVSWKSTQTYWLFVSMSHLQGDFNTLLFYFCSFSGRSSTLELYSLTGFYSSMRFV